MSEEIGMSEDTYSHLANESSQQDDQIPDHESSEDNESQAVDSTMDSNDSDSEDAEACEWATRAIVWRFISESDVWTWQQQAALGAPIQKLLQGATQRSQPSASDIEEGSETILRTMRAKKAVDDHAQVVQSFCIRARDAWSKVEEGPQHRSLVLEVFSSVLNWVAAASFKPSTMPSYFALPSSAVENLICRFDHRRHIWEQWIRPRMLRVGAHPPSPPPYPSGLTMWDARGLIPKAYFEKWEAVNGLNYDSFDALYTFWKINLPELLEKTHEELSEIFGRWDRLTERLSFDKI